MKQIKMLTAAVLLGAGLAGSAMAADGLTVTGDVHGASAYQYRGQQFSNGEPSIGASITAAHTSGLYGTVSTDTVKLSEGSSRNQLQSGLTVGYNHALPYDLIVGGGVTRNFFTGKDNVSDLSFSEAFVNAGWKGLQAKVSTVVESARFEAPGFKQGDTYGELGYTYAYGQFRLGGDAGYSWYHNHVGTRDGWSLAQLRVGYLFNDNVSVTLAHQLAGDNAYAEKSDATHVTTLKVGYKF